MRSLQQNSTQTNADSSNNNSLSNMNSDIEEGIKIAKIAVLVIIGVCSFMIVLFILYLIRLFYLRYVKRKQALKNYVQSGSDGQSVQESQNGNIVNKNLKELDKLKSIESVSINQDALQFDQSQKERMLLKEQNKEISVALEPQTSCQLEQTKINNHGNMNITNAHQQDYSQQDINLKNKFTNDRDLEIQQNIRDYLEKADKEIGQEEKRVQTNESQIFQFENQNGTILMTPQFNNHQNIFQFRGSERYSLHPTEESNKTLESIQLQNTGNIGRMSIKKKSLYEYNNQVLQPINQRNNMNKQRQQPNKGVQNSIYDKCKNQIMDFNQFQQLSEQQKTHQQSQMKNILLNKENIAQNLNQGKSNKGNPPKLPQVPKTTQFGPSTPTDKENQIAIKNLNFKTGLKDIREDVSQVFDD